MAEISEYKGNLQNIFENLTEDNIILGDFEFAINSILALMLKDKDNGEKVERLREYCEPYLSCMNYELKSKSLARNILSILNEKEEVFDVRKWLETEEAKIFKGGEYKIEFFEEFGVNMFFIKHNFIGDKWRVRYFGSANITKYFFEQLLKSLGIEL